MGKKPTKVVPVPPGIELTNVQILDAADGFGRLLKVKLPATLTFELQKKFQILKFAAIPINETRTEIIKRFTKRDKKGNPIAGEEPGTVIITNVRAFDKEANALTKIRQRVKVTPLRRSQIPEKVDGKPVIIEGEVWELLGPLLID